MLLVYFTKSVLIKLTLCFTLVLVCQYIFDLLTTLIVLEVVKYYHLRGEMLFLFKGRYPSYPAKGALPP